MDFDFKVTVWQRVNVPEEIEDHVLKAIKSGKITSAIEVYAFLNEVTSDIYCSTLLETEEQMTVEENDGNSTIEVVENGKTIWENGESN